MFGDEDKNPQEGSGQQLEDRAEEHRVGTPQNETQTAPENAQADSEKSGNPAPVEQHTEQVQETRTETNTESKPAEPGTEPQEQTESS